MNITKEELKTHGYLASKEEDEDRKVKIESLEKDIQDFLAKGGKVEEIPIGVTSNDGLLGRGRAQKEQEDAARIKASIASSGFKVKNRQNIRFIRGLYVVVVYNKRIGSYSDERDAVRARDSYREEQGYPKLVY